MRFVIEGPPATKKNSSRILRSKRGRPFVAPSAAFKRWERYAVLQLRTQAHATESITTPVNLRALIYRKRNVGDLDNYIAAVCDALQTAGVVVNDKLVQGHDGSRLLLDRARPRVEIELTPL